MQCPCRRPYDSKLEMILETDASERSGAIGAVLSQVHPGGIHPVAFLSKKMAENEQRRAVHGYR